MSKAKKLSCVPSDLFVGAILSGYHIEREKHPDRPVTCSHIWDRVVIQCLMLPPDGFRDMFAWDVSRAAHINRIGTIRQVIAAGYLPHLTVNERLEVHDERDG